MSQGPTRRRTIAHAGVHLRTTLGSQQSGAGHNDAIRRALDRTSPVVKQVSPASSDELWPPPVVETGSGSPFTATLTMTDDGAWSFSWTVTLTKGDPANIITLTGPDLVSGGSGSVTLGTVDAGGLLSGGGIVGEFGAGQTASFSLTTSSPPDTDITLTVRADLIRRGLSGHA